MEYKIKDNITGLHGVLIEDIYHDLWRIILEDIKLTRDETDYMIETLLPLYEGRAARLKQLKQLREIKRDNHRRKEIQKLLEEEK